MKKRKILLIVMCCALLAAFLLSGNVSAQAASSSEIRDQINEMEKSEETLRQKMEELENMLTDNLAEIEHMVAQKDVIDQQITLLYESIDNANDQIAAYCVLIADKQEELTNAEVHLAELNEKYKLRIRTMEEEGELSYWSILFQAGSFSDLLDRLDMVQEIAAADRRRLQQLSDAAAQVAAAKESLTEEKAALETARGELEGMQAILSEKQAQADALLQELLAQADEYENLLDQSEAEQEKLLEEIAKLEAEYDEVAYQEWLATYEPPTEATQVLPSMNGSGWLTPVPYYKLTSPFGMRLHPILGYERMHNGVDMACAAGTPIYASRGGQVTIAKYSSSAGNYVQINHGDGYSSVYMHMTNYVVSAGDYVAQGQLIGYVGNTGLSKGNHLHFGISYKGEYVNPMEYIG